MCTCLTERPSSPERGIDGQWVETTSQEIADCQIDDEHVGGRPQSFESVQCTHIELEDQKDDTHTDLKIIHMKPDQNDDAHNSTLSLKVVA